METLINLFDDFNLSTDENAAEIESTTYAAWIADMEAKLKAAIEEDELDMEDDFYASYKGVVKPQVYFKGIAVDDENMPTYDEVIDNCKPIDPIFD